MRILVTLLAAGWVLASCEPPSESSTLEAQPSDIPGAEGPERHLAATCTGTDSSPPSALLLSPSWGSTLTGTVTLSAVASDDVGVTRVEFYLGTHLLGTAFSAPYTVTWNSANLSNGAGQLTAQAYDAACNSGVSAPVDVTVQNAGNAAFDATRGVPACATVGSKCDSVELLSGRGPVGPEPHAPNTLGSACADGTEGSYHSSPSLDRLVVFRSDGTSFAAGKEVTVQAVVYASTHYAQEAVDLYAAPDANSPTWTWVSTLPIPGSGAQSLSASYLLPASGLQALRGVYRSGGSASAACVPGTLNDHDDLLLAVGQELDATPPSVVITSPQNTSTVNSDGSAGAMSIPVLSGAASVTVSASDNFGVQRVELYDGSSLVATDEHAPYSFTWQTASVPNGSHTLTARAYDAAGNIATSVAVYVSIDNDHTLPQVMLSSPANGTTVSESISLTADASDDRSTLRVDYYVDDTLVGSATAWPYAVNWNSRTVSNGPHTVRATAVDAVGNASVPSTASIVVDNDVTPPQITIASPLEGATLRGKVPVQFSTSDDRGVVLVELYANTYYWGGSSDTAPFTVSWDTRKLHNGTYTLTSKAYDAAGNVTTSAPVTVTLNNGGSADFDSTLGVPRCNAVDSYCDSLDLLQGRGGSGPEPHFSNTLDGCADGEGGYGYHNLESIDEINVSTSDGQPLAAGKLVNVHVTVWANDYGYQADSLDLYYTADALHPSWTYLTTVRPSYPKSQSLWGSYVLPAGTLQAVRANFHAYGNISPCSTGGFDDHDDLVFPVIVDTTPPTVAISAPASGDTVSEIVQVNASVSDDTSVAQVDFYDGQTLIRTVYYTPYSVVWNTRSSSGNGTHTLTAQARDSFGNVATSAPVTVTVNNDVTPPTVSLTAPVQGATLINQATLSASASDDRGIYRIELYDDSRLLSICGSSPCNYAWNTASVATGQHTLSARAFDMAGNESVSSLVTVTVARDTTPPSVSLTSPAAGATLTGSVTLSATATDEFGVNKVEFLVDGTVADTETPGYINPSSFNFSWNTKSALNGGHTLAARATDTNGNITTTPALSVTVDNDTTPPMVAFVSPSSGAQLSGSVSVQVSAVDNKAVSQVKLMVDGALQGTYFSAPYAFAWNTPSVSNGTHTLSAQAVDTSGNVSTTTTVTVTVYNDSTPPTVVLVSPANGTNGVGVLTLQAFASDDVAVTSVDFLVNGLLLGSVTAQPFSVSWDTTLEGNGSFTLTARAHDAVGHVTMSAPVTVNISQPNRAAYDATLQVPTCATAGALCDTMNLVASRGSTERNGPNTLDGCADGSLGVSSTDEKINRVKLTSVNGAAFEEGKPVRLDVDATIASIADTYNPGDMLDVYYTEDAAHPSWVYLTTLLPGATGAQTLSTQFNLTAGRLQAVRVQIRSNGSPVACHSGTYAGHDDRDDVAFAVNPSPDRAPPMVALTSPTNNQQVALVPTLTATASDDVAVTKVEFYDGATLIGTDATAPYSLGWDVESLPEGTHTLTAKAYDGVGHVTTSAPVTVIVDNTKPAGSVSAAARVRGTAQLSATASDNNGISRVEFWVNSALVATDMEAPYTASWETTSAPNGNATIYAEIYDIAGNVTRSASITVNVDNAAPSVAITSPANGASLSWLSLSTTVSASASDNTGVTQVSFYDGATLMGTDTTASYSVSWNLLTAAKGNHTLTAKAYDAAGNVTTSAPITVKVN